MGRSYLTDVTLRQANLILETGKTVAGKFEIIELIASGGMGTVYKARDLKLDRLVVLKVLQPSSDSAKAIIRFQNEAKILGRLNHRGIGGIYDIGALESGDPYIALEFIDGVTLQEFIDSHPSISLSQMLHIFSGIADALLHAHSAGVIHRDIKPSNIMLVRSSDEALTPVLLDFGIARIDDDTLGGGTATLTAPGMLVGSPLFMSPEQCQGQRVNEASDQYSLGCVFYKCLTGETPFVGETQVETLAMHINNAPVPPKDHSYTEIPQELNDLILKMLAKRPEDRLSGTAEVVRVLKALTDAALANEKQLARQREDARQEESDLKNEKRFTVKTIKAIGLGIVAFFLLCLVVFAVLCRLDISMPNFNMENRNKKEIRETLLALREKRSKNINVDDLGLSAIFTGADCSDDVFDIFDGYKFAEKINLSQTAVTGRVLKYFTKSKVSELVLNYTSVSDLNYISDYKWITKLEIIESGIGNDAIRRISELPRLKYLKVEQASNVTSDGIKALARSQSLEQAIISDCPKISGKSIDYLAEAMPLCSFPPRHPTSLMAKWNVQAATLAQAGNFAEAAVVNQKTVNAILKSRGESAPQAVGQIFFTENCYERLKNFPAMKKCIEQELSISRKDRNHNNLALVLGRLAHYLAEYEHDVGGAIAAVTEQLDLIKRYPGEISIPERECLFNLAILHRRNGDFEKAKELFEGCAAIDSSKDSLSGRRKHARDLVGIANADLTLNRLTAAQASLQKACELIPDSSSGENLDVYAEIAIGMSDYYDAMGDQKQGVAYARRAYDTLKRAKVKDSADSVGKYLVAKLRRAGRISEAAKIEKTFAVSAAP